MQQSAALLAQPVKLQRYIAAINKTRCIFDVIMTESKLGGLVCAADILWQFIVPDKS